MAGGETAQPLADYYVQQWKKNRFECKIYNWSSDRIPTHSMTN